MRADLGGLEPLSELGDRRPAAAPWRPGSCSDLCPTFVVQGATAASGRASRRVACRCGNSYARRTFCLCSGWTEGAQKVDKQTKHEVLIVMLASLVPIPLLTGAVVLILH
jgi:hypothetical protein